MTFYGISRGVVIYRILPLSFLFWLLVLPLFIERFDSISNLFVTTTVDHDPCSNRNWPTLDIFLPTDSSSASVREINEWFLPSLFLFWPNDTNANLLVVSDSENETREEVDRLHRNLTNSFNNMESTLSFEFRTSSRVFDCSGWDKAQWIKFWADNFTRSEYVGFVDTDTIFVSRVTQRDLFIDKKPIMRATFGKPRNEGFWDKVPSRTLTFTGLRGNYSLFVLCFELCFISSFIAICRTFQLR